MERFGFWGFRGPALDTNCINKNTTEHGWHLFHLCQQMDQSYSFKSLDGEGNVSLLSRLTDQSDYVYRERPTLTLHQQKEPKRTTVLMETGCQKCNIVLLLILKPGRIVDVGIRNGRCFWSVRAKSFVIVCRCSSSSRSPVTGDIHSFHYNTQEGLSLLSDLWKERHWGSGSKKQRFNRIKEDAVFRETNLNDAICLVPANKNLRDAACVKSTTIVENQRKQDPDDTNPNRQSIVHLNNGTVSS